MWHTIRKVLIELTPAIVYMVTIFVTAGIATVVEGMRWRRHFRRFMDQETQAEIEAKDERIANLEKELREVTEEKKHQDLQLKAIRGGLEL